MENAYIELTGGAYRIKGTRVSLDSLVYLYREGVSTEGMAESYPSLTLEQVHGALAYYLGHQTQIDSYLVDGQVQSESMHRASRETNANLIAKLRRARNEAPVSG